MQNLKRKIKEDIEKIYGIDLRGELLDAVTSYVERKTITTTYEVMTLMSNGELTRSNSYAYEYEAEWDWDHLVAEGKKVALLEEDVNGKWMNTIMSNFVVPRVTYIVITGEEPATKITQFISEEKALAFFNTQTRKARLMKADINASGRVLLAINY